MILSIIMAIMILFSMIPTGINPDGHSACHTDILITAHPGIWDTPLDTLITLPGIVGRTMIRGIIHLTEDTGAVHTCTAIIMGIMMGIITEEVIPDLTTTVLFITVPGRLSKTTGLPRPVVQEVSTGSVSAVRGLQG